MSFIQGLIAFLGRFFLSLIFIASGINQIFHWQEMEFEFINTLQDVAELTLGMESIQEIISAAISYTPFLLISAIVLQIIGGVSLMLGVQVRLGAFLLIAFLTPTTLLFHHFWLLPDGPERQQQLVELMKNVSILGGLLVVLAYGKGQRRVHCNEPSESEEKSG